MGFSAVLILCRLVHREKVRICRYIPTTRLHPAFSYLFAVYLPVEKGGIPVKTLQKYIITRFVLVLVACEITLTALFAGIDIAEHMELFRTSSFQTVIKYYLSLSVVIITAGIPIAIAVAAGITLMAMKKRGELGAVFTAAVSPSMVVEAFKRASYVIILLTLLSFEVLVPPAMSLVTSLIARENPLKIQEGAPVAIFTGNTLLFSTSVQYEKAILKDVIVIEGFFDPIPENLYVSPQGLLEGGTIILHDVYNFSTSTTSTTRVIQAEVHDPLAGKSGVLAALTHSTYELANLMSAYTPKDILFSRYTAFIMFRLIFLILILVICTGAVKISIRSPIFDTLDISACTISLLIFMVIGICTAALPFIFLSARPGIRITGYVLSFTILFSLPAIASLLYHLVSGTSQVISGRIPYPSPRS